MEQNIIVKMLSSAPEMAVVVTSSFDKMRGEAVIEAVLSMAGTLSGLSIKGESPPVIPFVCAGGGAVCMVIGMGGGKTKTAVTSAT